MSIKHFIRQSLWRVGLDVTRYNPVSSEASQLAKQLSAQQVDVVFDVGANTGQFAAMLRAAEFRGRIVSFEPSTSAHSILLQQVRSNDNWKVAPRMALGDRDGTTTLNLAANSFSSSVLTMLPSHVSAAPESRYIGTETADLRKLDSIGAEFATETERIFLKLDVQGFESSVLQGAKEFLRQVVGIQIELSLVPLYEGETLFHPMLHKLEEEGFEMWSIVPGLVDPKTKRLLQVDGIFFRNDLQAKLGLVPGHEIASRIG